MKPSSVPSLLAVAALLAPPLHAQESPAKVREIERKVLHEQYRDAVQALAGTGREAGAAKPDLVRKRLQWLTLVSTRIDGGGKTAVTNGEEAKKNAVAINDLAWSMIVSPDAASRHPDIALKLADIAIELAGGDKALQPGFLNTKARAMFLSGRKQEAREKLLAEMEKAIAATPEPKQKAVFEEALAAYKKGEVPPVPPGPGFETSGTAYIVGKLRRIIIPRIDFENVTVEEAIEFLRKAAVEADAAEPDPARKGINFVIQRPRPDAAGAKDPANDPGTSRVKELRVRNVPLEIALRYICDQAKLRYKVDDFAVTLMSRNAQEDNFTRTFQAPPGFGSPGVPIQDFLKSRGVNFREGTSATLDSAGMLLVVNTPTELDKIEMLLESAMRKATR